MRLSPLTSLVALVALAGATVLAATPSVARAQTTPPSATPAATPAAPPNAIQQALLAQLRTRLDSIASHADGVVGYAVYDPATGGMPIARLERAVFPTASTIKLAILDEMFRQADAGTLDIDTPRAIPKSAVVGGSGVLLHLTAPQMPLRDIATLMMIVSDNTATNLLIDAVGMERVNARIATLGVPDVRLRRKMIDAAAVRRGDENVASPHDLAVLAYRLWNGDGLTPASRNAARRMLYAVPGRMRSAVPATVRVALKTGSLDGVRAEAAVVEVPGHPFAIAVMTTYLANDERGSDVIEAITAEVYRTMARLAAGGAYGRTIP
ncbi:MAG: class A beta-lactamase-related serine hydrolase [Gemmatimonadaceae bacterium]|nr:class A beta-lactamase-related serine hydrolase [Gemmatimonadaceae bacterium]